MSLRLYWIAAKIRTESQVTQKTLEVMAARACDQCGFEWPGLAWLMEYVGASDRAVQQALQRLIAAGHIVIHAYPRGGRARATEYVILPNEAQGPAPCLDCQRRKVGPLENGAMTPADRAELQSRWTAARHARQAAQGKLGEG